MLSIIFSSIAKLHSPPSPPPLLKQHKTGEGGGIWGVEIGELRACISRLMPFLFGEILVRLYEKAGWLASYKQVFRRLTSLFFRGVSQFLLSLIVVLDAVFSATNLLISAFVTAVLCLRCRRFTNAWDIARSLMLSWMNSRPLNNSPCTLGWEGSLSTKYKG